MGDRGGALRQRRRRHCTGRRSMGYSKLDGISHTIMQTISVIGRSILNSYGLNASEGL